MKPEFRARETKAERPHQFNLKALLLITAVVALPLGIWEFRNTRSREYAEAAQPFMELGGRVASNPGGFVRFLELYLFHAGDHRITSISFMDEPLTDQQLESLHDELHSLPNLNRLLLEDTMISDEGLSVVADIKKLSWIRLDGTTVTDEGVALLQSLALMKELGLARTSVTDVGLKHLDKMSQLRTLMLSDTQVTDAGVFHLKDKASLRMLTLRNTGITDDGLPGIAGLANLETLDLAGTNTTNNGLRHLDQLNQLRNLSLEGTKVTEEGVRRTREMMRQCRVYSDFDK